MRAITVSTAGAASLVFAWGISGLAHAETLSGVYNTGRSSVDDTQSGTLDVKFHPCKDDIALSCGTVVRVVDPADPSNPQTMPDGQPMVGFTMVTGLEDQGEGKFRGGKINAVDESLDEDKMIWYGVKIDVEDDGRLKLKGCLGFVCPRTLYWTPVVSDNADAAEKDAIADDVNEEDAIEEDITAP
ncbi:MAG: DUF2147 domain-containing protein [Pseudomonadota bacterium]